MGTTDRKSGESEEMIYLTPHEVTYLPTSTLKRAAWQSETKVHVDKKLNTILEYAAEQGLL